LSIHAIIPAAGQGRRFGGAKQFQILAGKPLLLYSLEAFESCSLIQTVCLVVPEGDLDRARDLVRKNKLKKISLILPGGSERQESVRIGFKALPPSDFIVVHDAARPFVTPDLLLKLIEGAKEFGGCLAGTPARDTIKRVDPEGMVRETVDRSALWNIQTPQVFRYDLLKKAFEKAVQDHFVGTDEAMLVERLGVKIKVIDGGIGNMKITTPEDLKIAEGLMARQAHHAEGIL